VDKPIGYVISEGYVEPTNVKIIKDQSTNKRLVAEGILQDAEVDNRNGRFYEKVELEPEIKGGRIQELIATGNMKGEDGHPQSTELTRQQTIDPTLTCVKYLKIWMDGNDVKAHFCGTNNDRGEYFDQDLRDGELPSFSLRALGTILNRAGHAYVKNTKIITWDRVIYPSHKRAYTTGLVTEGATIGSDQNKMVYTENDKGILIPITNSSVMNYIKTESANVKTIMNNFDTLYDQISLIENNTKVQLIAKETGDIFVVGLENYIQNEIMDYVSKY